MNITKILMQQKEQLERLQQSCLPIGYTICDKGLIEPGYIYWSDIINNWTKGADYYIGEEVNTYMRTANKNKRC